MRGDTTRLRRLLALGNEVLLVGVLVALAITVSVNVGAHFSGHRPVDAFAVVLLVAGPLSLLARHRDPAWPALLVAAVLVIYVARGYWLGPVFLAFVAALVIAELAGRSLAARSAAAAVVGTLVVCLATDTGPELDGPQVFGITAWIAVIVAISALVRARSEAARQRRERAEEEARRVSSEGRLQLARDLHDVLAHSLSVINVQASVALHLIDDRDKTQEALSVIKTTSRETLAEIRHALNALRGADAAPVNATVGLHDVDRLVETARAAGLDVAVEIDGDARRIPAHVDIAAYRIVQESLTNVTKHSAADRASVTVAYRPDAVLLSVADPGPGRPRSANGSGHGLQGMRERVAQLGGRVSAQPRFDGGFTVEAELPLEEAE